MAQKLHSNPLANQHLKEVKIPYNFEFDQEKSIFVCLNYLFDMICLETIFKASSTK